MNSWRLSGCAWPACLLVLCCLFFFVNVILIYLKHINRCRPPREAIWRGDGVFRNNFQTKWNYQNVGSCCCCWMNLSRGSRAFLFIFLKIPTRIHDDTHTHTNKSPNPWRKISRLLLWNISKWWWTSGVGFGGDQHQRSAPHLSPPTSWQRVSRKWCGHPALSLIPMKITGWQGGCHPRLPRPFIHRQLQVIRARCHAAVVCGNCKLLLKSPGEWL